MAPLEGKRAPVLIALESRAAAAHVPFQPLQQLIWQIMGGLSYSEIPPQSQQLVDQLIPEYKNQIKEDFIETLQKNTHKLDWLCKSLPGVCKASAELDALIQRYQQTRQTLLQNINNFEALSRQLVNVLPGTAQNSGPASWSRVSPRVYARLTDGNVFGQLGHLEIRVLPSNALGAAASGSSGKVLAASFGPNETSSITGAGTDLAEVPLQAMLAYPNASNMQGITGIPGDGGGQPGPQITSVSSILPQQNQTIKIIGSGLGTQAAYNGDSQFIQISDVTQNWSAGHSGDWLTLNVTSWTDTQISIQNFSVPYATNVFFRGGDRIQVKVWNPQSKAGPGEYSLVVLDSLVLQIAPPSGYYMLFDCSELSSLQNAVLRQLPGVSGISATCQGVRGQPPSGTNQSAIWIGAGVVNQQALSSYIREADFLIGLPTNASEPLTDFHELGTWGLAGWTSARFSYPQGLNPPEIVTLAVNQTILGVTQAWEKLLQQHACWAGGSSVGATYSPLYIVGPGQYLEVLVTGLSIPAGANIDLSSLSSAQYAEASNLNGSLQICPSGNVGYGVAETTLSSPVGNLNACPTVSAAVVDGQEMNLAQFTVNAIKVAITIPGKSAKCRASTLSVVPHTSPTQVIVPAIQPWTDTGIAITAGDRLQISASGKIYAGSLVFDPYDTPDGQGTVSRDGYTCLPKGSGLGGQFLVAGVPCWSLVGRIGENGTPFEVGSHSNFVAKTSGELYLGVNDNFFPDNSGNWTADISVTSAGSVASQKSPTVPPQPGASSALTISLSVNPAVVAPGGQAVVSGVVRDSNGKPVANTTVQLAAAAGGVATSPSTLTTDANGSFSTGFTSPPTEGIVTLRAAVGGSRSSATATLKVVVGTSKSTRPIPQPTATPQAKASQTGSHVNRRIQSVDFYDFDYRSDCWEQFNVDKVVHVSKGEWHKEGSGYFKIARIVYGDLKEDGVEEAVVHTGCSGESNFDYQELFVFAMSRTGPELLVRLSPSDWGKGEEDNGGQFPISGMEIREHQLFVSFLAGGSHACPDWIVTTKFQWDGRRFVRVGMPTRKPYKCG